MGEEKLTVAEKYTSLKASHERLKKIHDSTNEAVGNLHEALNLAAEENAQLKRQVQNGSQDLDQQKEIVRQHIEQGRESENSLVTEIRRLKVRLREYGDND